MGGKLLVIIISSLLACPFVMAKKEKSSERFHYKCHVSLTNGEKLVHGFVSPEQDKDKFETELKGRIVFSQDGVTGDNIDSVYECVKAEKSFKSREAQALEESTPF